MADASHDGDASKLAADSLLCLVDEHHRSLYAYAYRLSGSAADAEDLTQQTFLTAHRKLTQLRERDKALPWLYQVLRRHFLKSRRRRQPFSQTDFEIELQEFAPADAVDSPVDSEQLQQALGSLPDDYKLVLLMFYFEELSYKEIAEQLDIPIGTVMSRLARAKSALRTKLTKGLKIQPTRGL
jgi:RNA polymerase sigma-70 factor (ECF subfamily)